MENTVENKSMSSSMTAASNPWSTIHRSNTAESPAAGQAGVRSRAPGAGRGFANSNNNVDWSSPTSSKSTAGAMATSQDRRNGVPAALDTGAQPFSPATLHESPTTNSHATSQNQYSSHFSPHNGNGSSRAVSTSAVGSIGSERRAANSSANESVKSSRAASPTPQQAPGSLQGSVSNLRAAATAREFQPTIAVSNAHDSSAAVNGSSASSSTAELESAFDAMLRGSPLFQDVLTRLGQLEGHVNSLLAHALPGGTGNSVVQNAAPLSLVPPSGPQNYDSTPTRSPSVVSTTGSFLSAQTNGPYVNAPNLSNSITSAASVMSTNLHSPAMPNASFIHAATEPSTPNSERDVIRQLTLQLSALGHQVAQLTAQQSQSVPAMLQSPSAMSTPAATPLSAAGGPWSFDGQQSYGPPGAGGHAGPHFMNGRPALSALRATSYDVQRGGPGPRNGPYGDERDGPRSALPSGKRGPHHLHAPTPLGMGSRRHSADIVDNMNAAAESASGMQGAGVGNQSLLGKWESLGVSGDLLRAIVKYGIGPPSKIQMKAIPCILNSQDIVAQASSIQERIQCYVIPVLQHVHNRMMRSSTPKMADSAESQRTSSGIHAMIITATIDQAGQAHRMCLGLGQSLGIASMLAVGQGDVTAELNTLTNNPPHLLVGTPQKILDLLSKRSVAVDRMTLLVIDEMDQLIARNLSEYVNNVAKLLPAPVTGPGSGSRDRSIRPIGRADNATASSPTRPDNDRQTAIFSCTVPQEVLNFASALNLREPVRVLVRRENNQDNGPANSQAPNLRGMKHFFLYLAVSGTGSGGPGHIDGRQMTSPGVREWKLEALADLCADADFTQAVVFCSSLDSVDAVQYKLMSRSIEAFVLHGDMGPAARNTVISKFRSANGRGVGIKRVLVVYDALCRTLSDIHQVALVVNYDLPRSVEDYVHRVACATASGYSRAGTSVNMAVNAGDVEMLRSIESFYRIKINELPPTLHNLI